MSVSCDIADELDGLPKVAGKRLKEGQRNEMKDFRGVLKNKDDHSSRPFWVVSKIYWVFDSVYFVNPLNIH